MTMAPDPDDILAHLEAQFDDVDTTDVVDVSSLDSESLLKNYAAVNIELQDRKEKYNPHTPEGRELHSLRYAYQLELRKRRLL